MHSIIRIVSSKQVLQFQPDWIQRLLTLFGSKEEIQLFWTIFSQNFMPVPLQQPLTIKQQNLSNFQLHMDFQSQKTESQRPIPPEDTDIYLDYEDDALDCSEFQGNQRAQQSQMSQSAFSLNRKQSFLTAEEQASMSGHRQKNSITRQIAEAMKRDFKQCKQSGDKFIVRQYAQKFNVHKTTIYRLMNKWENEIMLGKLLVKSNKYNKRAPNKGTVDYQVGQWTKAIESLVKQNPYLSVQQIKAKLKLQGFVFIPTSSNIKDILTTLKYTAKKTTTNEVKKSNETVFIRKRYCEVYLGMLKRPDLKIFFVDEKKIDLTNNDYSWSKPNSTTPQKASEAFVSLFLMLSDDGSCHWQTFPNSTAQAPTKKLQMESIFQSISSKKSPNHNIITVVNRQNIEPGYFKGLISKYQWKMVILPPGSPELNPAFYFFKEVKVRIKKILPQLRNATEIEECLRKLCPTISEWKSKFEEINSFAEFGVDSEIIA